MVKPFCIAAAVAVLSASSASVVINEIMYHPPTDGDELQYIELLNTSEDEVDLTGWQVAGGVRLKLPTMQLPPGGTLVVARDTNAFQRAYREVGALAGNFTGKLSHKGEKLQLLDRNGAVVETVEYQDKAPWPVGADGYGGSLERITPSASAADPRNWATSLRPSRGRPGGTPGATNTTASAHRVPTIQNVQWQRLLAPETPIEVTAEVEAAADVDTVTLRYQVIFPGKPGPREEVAMSLAARGRDPAGARQYRAEIPGQAAGALVRFGIRAIDAAQAVRIEPGRGEPRPTFSAYVSEPLERATIPTFTIVNPVPLRRGGNNKMGPPRKDVEGGGQSAVVYVPPEGEAQLFDFVEVSRRDGGFKVKAFRDQPIAEMTGLNLIFEGPRWSLAEHLSYEVYRKAGMNIQKSGHARLTLDGRPLGYFLMVEQPNKHFLERSGRPDSGNLYKVLWYGNGIVSRHEKKTNEGEGHDDIIELIETLQSRAGASQWAYIQEQFKVDAFANYYAVNMCIQNWDGFFNNHFVYHDLKKSGKWDILPWDEDKTWGDYDGAPDDYSWYDMPITVGMANDRPARTFRFFGRGGGGPFGGSSWWRPPGYLSGPLLANPQFRARFEARLRELCTNVFTPEAFGPVIDDLKAKLRPEVEFKARAAGQDPEPALKEFDDNIASFHRQLANRPKQVLSQLKE